MSILFFLNWPQLQILETNENEGKLKYDISRKRIKNYETFVDSSKAWMSLDVDGILSATSFYEIT